MMSLQTILAVGSGGFIGAIARAYLNTIISSKLPHTLPFATLSINLLGSFLMGILIALFMQSNFFSLHTKSFLTTGILGGFTTYSAFAMESFLIFSRGEIALALANIILNAFGSVFFAGVGYMLTRKIF